MINKFFISYATPDIEIAKALKNFIYGLEAGAVDIFMCDDSIRVGENFDQIIMRKLSESCCFIPLLSPDYFKSKYCMIELGAACVYYYNYKNFRSKLNILPVAIPPIRKENALNQTPISKLQAVDLSSDTGITRLTYELYKEYRIPMPGYSNRQDLLEVIGNVLQRRIVPTLRVKPQLFYDTNACPKKSSDIVLLKSNNEGDAVFFNLKPNKGLDARVATFVSCAYLYPTAINLSSFLFSEENYALYAHIIHSRSLRSISVELKNAYAGCPPYVQTFNLNAQEDDLYIELNQVSEEALSKIAEICFVVHPNDCDLVKGEFTVTQLCVKKFIK